MTTTTKRATAGDGCQRARGVTTSDACIDRLRNTGRHVEPTEHDVGLRNERGGEHQTLTDAARIAELEAEGLTHSDAVGVMEAEKLARQPEPAAEEERRWQMSSPMVNHMVATDLKTSDHKPIGIDMEDDQDMHYAAVQVFAGEDVAREVFRAVNNHTQLVAALESELEALRVWQKARDFDLEDVRAGFRISIDKIQRALRLAKDGE
jgi:hypothetical protein